MHAQSSSVVRLSKMRKWDSERRRINGQRRKPCMELADFMHDEKSFNLKNDQAYWSTDVV